MAYSVDNIIPLTVSLSPSGLSFANFSSVFAFGVDADLKTPGSIPVDTFKDYASLAEVGEDFDTASPPYLMARRWFANLPKPAQFSVWLWDDVADSAAEVAAKAHNTAWRYWYSFPKAVTDVEVDAKALADFMDANGHHMPFVTSDPNAEDPMDTTDIGSVLTAAGNRRVFAMYREAATITADASQAYAALQLAAAFNKFRPEGQNTAITGEFQVLPGVTGESLTTTAYNALKAKNIVFATAIELQGSTDASRVINSRSFSSFGEFIDDVVNLDVLQNRLQVAGYNYVANAGTKRALTQRGYAGLLAVIGDTFKGFFDNGVLGESEYTDPATGEDEIAKYGYVIFAEPEDVFGLSASQKSNREYPDTSTLAILARAGHQAAITVNVE